MTITPLKDKKRPIEILLVEDNYGDAMLIKKAFEKASMTNHIAIAEDGEQAIHMLKKKGEYKAQSTPDLVLLDINLPKLNGKEVLDRIKQNDTLKHIPVLMLTSSSAEMDVIKSYQLHANGYIVKPVNLNQFANIVAGIEQFWFQLVLMPGEKDIKSHNAGL